MLNNSTKKQALNLRLKGFSYAFIAKKLSISKSTSYLWLKNIALSKNASQRLLLAQLYGQKKGLKKIEDARTHVESEIKQRVGDTLKQIHMSKENQKLLCSILYWSEGEKSKRVVAFTNSDPLMIRLFIKLFVGSFGVSKLKIKAFLHLHDYHNVDRQVIFWSKQTGIHKNRITVYNKQSQHTYKKPNYPGCISIRYYDAKIAKEIFFLYSNFAQNMGAW